MFVGWVDPFVLVTCLVSVRRCEEGLSGSRMTFEGQTKCTIVHECGHRRSAEGTVETLMFALM